MNGESNYSDINLNLGFDVESSEVLYTPISETKSFADVTAEKVQLVKEKVNFTERGAIISGGTFCTSFISSIIIMSLEINRVIAPHPIYETAALCSVIFSLTGTSGFIFLNMKYSKELALLGG